MKKLIRVVNNRTPYDITGEINKELQDTKQKIPTKVSELINDANYITEHDADDDEPMELTEVITTINLILN